MNWYVDDPDYQRTDTFSKIPAPAFPTLASTPRPRASTQPPSSRTAASGGSGAGSEKRPREEETATPPERKRPAHVLESSRRFLLEKTVYKYAFQKAPVYWVECGRKVGDPEAQTLELADATDPPKLRSLSLFGDPDLERKIRDRKKSMQSSSEDGERFLQALCQANPWHAVVTEDPFATARELDRLFTWNKVHRVLQLPSKEVALFAEYFQVVRKAHIVSKDISLVTVTTMQALREAIGKEPPVDLAVVDCGGNGELLKQQVLIALASLQNDSWLVVKCARILDRDTIDLAYLLSHTFERIALCKPHTSPFLSEDLFLVCQGFHLSDNDRVLSLLLEAITSKDATNTTTLSLHVKGPIPEAFSDSWYTAHVSWGMRQKLALDTVEWLWKGDERLRGQDTLAVQQQVEDQWKNGREE